MRGGRREEGKVREEGEKVEDRRDVSGGNVKEMGEDQGGGRKVMWLGRGKGAVETVELRRSGCGGGDEGTET